MENNITELLSKKMPDEAIQRTKKADTRKGYDTDGYGYQYIVDRLNEVAGDKWFFTWDIIHTDKGAYKSGVPYYEITVRVDIWLSADGKGRACVGGHTAMTYADALKGAITNGFKKTAAFWGVGRDAYAGTIDDDNTPLPDEAKNKVNSEKAEKMYVDLINKIEVCQKVLQLENVGNEIKANVSVLSETQLPAIRETYKRRMDELKLEEVAG